ncbi:MAG: AbrB/MazE/SpoVT family DNA-binding domain-containing protein [Bryobacterales bacterium]|nr:AbrB/MazE/SpoVT family DNA-binding domain-containing protein [Bryobacterales bacterium]
MGRVTSKLQVTVPKSIADRYGIRPGDDLEWVPAGDAGIRVTHAQAPPAGPADATLRLKLFDEATERQRQRKQGPAAPTADRGWKREDLYHRGRTR